MSNIDFTPAEMTATGVLPSSVRSEDISIVEKGTRSAKETQQSTKETPDLGRSGMVQWWSRDLVKHILVVVVFRVGDSWMVVKTKHGGGEDCTRGWWSRGLDTIGVAASV
ncbi:hypothetical protein E6C27_scaffold977G00790 [Cucumis melo var. makuwa]|uniref:Uncharacterized protein n=1 Tax=Cucumis melo var. makuwa TaxID=1194695 RepID=A0A5A7V7C6_CUCMM|nr:hypothetical protein E6C27_scaffold977G00790 [Cucumis melo var. makuwa]